jgi:hypothetical protein
LTARQDLLREWVERSSVGEITWGKDDCTAWAAGWVHHLTGLHLPRPDYATRGEAMTLIAAAGGLEKIWEAALSPFPETSTPVLGDVALIDTARFGPVGCIVCEDGIVAWRSTTKCVFLQPRSYLRAWSIR